MSGNRITAEQMDRDIAAAWARGEHAAKTGERVPRPNHCGGASLLVNRAEAWAMQHGGVKFDTDPGTLPPEGREMIRVRCNDFCAYGLRDGRRIEYALCNDFMGKELANRKYLAKCKEQREAEERQSGPRKRRKFGEGGDR